jgi:hypothetical protein
MPFSACGEGNILFDGGYRNREKITVPNRNYGVVIMPGPIYKYPKGHPCYGCVFVFKTSRPSCLAGCRPDTENCVNTFYRKMLSRHQAGYVKWPEPPEPK